VAARSRLVAGLVLTVALLAGGASPAHASHRDGRDRDGCYDACYDGDGYSQDYDGQWSNEDRNRNRNRNRGAFSPGPFDRSPIDFSNSCISLDCSGRDEGGKKKEPPKGQQPSSLTDPRKLPSVIAQIAKAGLDMGQLFATTTIKFVETLFTALA
jgi:hypothetical protein